MSFEERHRPKTWEEIKGNQVVVSKIKEMVEEEVADPKMKMRPILFVGVQGTGKTTCVSVIRRRFKVAKGDFKEVNMSKSGTIDYFREIITKFCETTSLNHKYRKILVLEEFDNASKATQQAFRRDIETMSTNVLFLFTANKESAVIPPIRDRCYVARFKRVSSEDIVTRLKELADQETIQYEENDLWQIAEMSDGQVRSAVGMLGSYKMGDPVAMLGSALAKSVDKFLDLCVNGTYAEACKFVVDVVENLDVDERQFLLKLREKIIESKLKPEVKRQFVILAADTDYRIAIGAHPKISIDWLVASIQSKVRKKPSSKPPAKKVK